MVKFDEVMKNVKSIEDFRRVLQEVRDTEPDDDMIEAIIEEAMSKGFVKIHCTDTEELQTPFTLIYKGKNLQIARNDDSADRELLILPHDLGIKTLFYQSL